MQIQIKMDRLPTAKKLKSESAAASAAEIAAQLDSVKSAKAATSLRERLQKAIQRESDANAKLLQRFDAKLAKLYPEAAPKAASTTRRPATVKPPKVVDNASGMSAGDARRAAIALKAAVKEKFGIPLTVNVTQGADTRFSYSTSRGGATGGGRMGPGVAPGFIYGGITVVGTKAMLSMAQRVGPKSLTKEGLRKVVLAAFKPFGIKTVELARMPTKKKD